MQLDDARNLNSNSLSRIQHCSRRENPACDPNFGGELLISGASLKTRANNSPLPLRFYALHSLPLTSLPTNSSTLSLPPPSLHPTQSNPPTQLSLPSISLPSFLSSSTAQAGNSTPVPRGKTRSHAKEPSWAKPSLRAQEMEGELSELENHCMRRRERPERRARGESGVEEGPEKAVVGREGFSP